MPLTRFPSRTERQDGLQGQALAAEIARLDVAHAPAKAKAGSLGGLLASYQAVPRFTDLADRAKADYRKIIDYLEPLRDMPLAQATSGFIAQLRDKTLKKRRAGFTTTCWRCSPPRFSTAPIMSW